MKLNTNLQIEIERERESNTERFLILEFAYFEDKSHLLLTASFLVYGVKFLPDLAQSHGCEREYLILWDLLLNDLCEDNLKWETEPALLQVLLKHECLLLSLSYVLLTVIIWCYWLLSLIYSSNIWHRISICLVINRLWNLVWISSVCYRVSKLFVILIHIESIFIHCESWRT